MFKTSRVLKAEAKAKLRELTDLLKLQRVTQDSELVIARPGQEMRQTVGHFAEVLIDQECCQIASVKLQSSEIEPLADLLHCHVSLEAIVAKLNGDLDDRIAHDRDTARAGVCGDW